MTIGRVSGWSLFRNVKANFSTSRRLGTAEGEVANVSKPKLKWAEKGENEDFDAAERYLSLLCSDAKAATLVKSLRNAKLAEHAAKDLLRAAHLPLLPSDEFYTSARI